MKPIFVPEARAFREDDLKSHQVDSGIRIWSCINKDHLAGCTWSLQRPAPSPRAALRKVGTVNLMARKVHF